MQPFVWMFKVKEFKKHYLYLALLTIVMYVLYFGLTIIPISASFQFLANAAAYICSIIPGLYILGYFWNLTEQIIHRDRNIEANSIYDGKIKETYTITLPELDFINNVWRGVASIVATILLIIPFVIIMFIGIRQGTLAALPPAFAIFIPVFLSLFFPALFWNFAYKGSVIAVWNIRKAIYLVGNYTTKYFLNVIILLVISVISGLIDYFLLIFAFSTANFVIIAAAYAIVGIKDLYCIFVNAYLIGTITPTSEA